MIARYLLEWMLWRGSVNLISWSMVDVRCGWVIFDPYGHECFYLRLMYVVHEVVGHFLQ